MQMPFYFYYLLLCGFATATQHLHQQHGHHGHHGQHQMTECKTMGCSSTVCGSKDTEEMFSICNYLQHYSCFSNMKCEMQLSTGVCGWTRTEETRKCLIDNDHDCPAELSESCDLWNAALDKVEDLLKKEGIHPHTYAEDKVLRADITNVISKKFPDLSLTQESYVYQKILDDPNLAEQLVIAIKEKSAMGEGLNTQSSNVKGEASKNSIGISWAIIVLFILFNIV